MKKHFEKHIRNPIYIFLRRYMLELVGLAVNTGLAYVNYIYWQELHYSLVFSLSLLIFFFTVVIIIFLKSKGKNFLFYELDSANQGKNWMGRGKFFYLINENSYEITESDVGYITADALTWDDYTFIFDFKIINKSLACIVRATNLSNYIMFQINGTGINPHIRLNSQWIKKKQNDSDVNLQFDKPLSPDAWYTAKITCEKRNTRIVLYDNAGRAIFDRHWIIPESLQVKYLVSEDSKDEIKLLQHLDFDFGTIGFRNWGDEKGLVKKVYLEKL